VDGIIRTSETKEAVGELINLASGQAVTIRKVIDEIVSLCQGGKPQFGTVPYRLGENMSLYADISKAERLLKWSPRISLKQGLEKTIESFQSAVPSRAV
jgi:nucleoside-diphosphate-sugar epimerase